MPATQPLSKACSSANWILSPHIVACVVVVVNYPSIISFVNSHNTTLPPILSHLYISIIFHLSHNEPEPGYKLFFKHFARSLTSDQTNNWSLVCFFLVAYLNGQLENYPITFQSFVPEFLDPPTHQKVISQNKIPNWLS